MVAVAVRLEWASPEPVAHLEPRGQPPRIVAAPLAASAVSDWDASAGPLDLVSRKRLGLVKSEHETRTRGDPEGRARAPD